MSKEAAMQMLNPAPTETPTTQSPGLQAVPSPETPAVPKLDSDSFAHLAKKEAALVKERQAFRLEQDQIAKEKEQIQKIKAQYDEWNETKAKDPIAALKKLGFSETDVLNYLAEAQPGELTPEQKAAQIAKATTEEALKAFQEEQAKKAQESLAERDKRLITNFRSEMGKVMEADKDKYEYCNFYGPAAQELAYETVLEVVKQSEGKELITAKEAMDLVEEYYEDQDKAMSALKKRQPKSSQPTQPATPERSRTVDIPPGSAPPRPTITKTRTLTNGAVATSASMMKKGPETHDQKRERLIAALRNGKLN